MTTTTAHSSGATPLGHEEIDFAIAERVMGWRYEQVPGGGNGYFVRWYDADDKRLYSYMITETSAWGVIWQPSTRIAQAWQVLEHVRRDSDSVVLQTLKDRWVCSINGKIYAMGIGDTAPLAICLAALKAVGVQP